MTKVQTTAVGTQESAADKAYRGIRGELAIAYHCAKSFEATERTARYPEGHKSKEALKFAAPLNAILEHSSLTEGDCGEYLITQAIHLARQFATLEALEQQRMVAGKIRLEDPISKKEIHFARFQGFYDLGEKLYSDLFASARLFISTFDARFNEMPETLPK